jgi:hypothetical protein
MLFWGESCNESPVAIATGLIKIHSDEQGFASLSYIIKMN